MAGITKGTIVSFGNTPQAKDDVLAPLTEDAQGVYYFDVMANDLGGNAKTLLSLDDGSSEGGTRPADLLQQDTGRTQALSGDQSQLGASIWITPEGKVGYDVSSIRNELQKLAAGEYTTDSFTYAIRLGSGALSWATATIQIAGVNDVPVITSSTQAGTVKEDTALTVSGQVTASDVDHGATAAYSGNATGSYGSFEVNAGTGAWTYTLDNAAHQNLAEGESQSETFTVTVTDDKGGTATQDVTITVQGTNDVPVITSSTQAGTVKEDTALTVSGQVSASDVDHGATAVYSGNATGSYGSFAVNAGTGEWTYTLDNAAHQNLAEGESQSETFTVTVTDDKGGTATQDVTITVQGTNDVPVITSSTQAGTVKEDTALTVSGQVSASDVDHGATAAYSGNATGSYGSFAVNAGTGAWTYTLDNAAHQNLAEGESQSETFTVTVTDDKGATATQDVTITVQGTNDVPVIRGVVTGTASEDGVSSTLDALANASDVDGNTTLAVVGLPTALPAGVSYDAASHSFTLDPSNAAYQYLAAGQPATVTVDYGVSDGTVTTAASISWAVTGTNDTAVIGAPTVAVVTEDSGVVSGNLTAAGSISISDVDQDQAAFQTMVAGPAGNLGSLTLEANGSYTYTVANSAVQYLGAGDSKIDSYTVTAVDGTTKEVSFTIHGTNDVTNTAPTNITLRAVVGDDALPNSGLFATLSTTDADVGDAHSYSISAVGGTPDIFNVSGSALSITEGLKNNTTYSFQISSTDSAGATYNEIFNVITGNGNGNTLPTSPPEGYANDDILYGLNNNDILIGGTGDDTLFGQVGNDVLYGGTGNDVLKGGAGSDTFVFNAALNASTNVDTVTDFVSGLDKIHLENTGAAMFNVLPTGVLSAGAFDIVGVGPAAGANTRIIYDPGTGALSYDADGTGGGAAVQIATIGTATHPTALSNTDFLVI